MEVDATMLGSESPPASKCSVDFVQPVRSDSERSVCRLTGFPGAVTTRCGNLIDLPFTKDQRVSLIEDLFSDGSEMEALKDLGGGDAQSFIDMVDEVSHHSCVGMTGLLT